MNDALIAVLFIAGSMDVIVFSSADNSYGVRQL